MHTFLVWLEKFTNRIIPFLVILLAVLLIIDNPFWKLVDLQEHQLALDIFDGIIVFFFVIDLTYKWFKVRKIPRFIRLYWIDIIAVFPFYLGFRVYREIADFFRIGEEVTETAQKIAHETILLKETELLKEQRLLRDTELLKETKPGIRFLRFVQRLLRALKGRFYVTHLGMKKESGN